MSVDAWNGLIDHFDVEALARQLQFAGARYYQISICQNSGYYLSPNSVNDELTGIEPSECTRHDLVADLAAALSPCGISPFTISVMPSSIGSRQVAET
jgi:hypothetical protein